MSGPRSQAHGADPLMPPGLRHLTKGTVSADARSVDREDPSSWEEFYRDRWRHDKEVRSTHGVNCTGSCSWKVYVRDGIISWETQQTDYPQTPPGVPDHEPRGCPRGASFSWYVYSPARVRFPYVRGALLRSWRSMADSHPDPVERWSAIQADTELVARYKGERGRGGLMRATYHEAVQITAAAHVHTIKVHGPDRAAAFTPLPAMSPVSYASGSRYMALTGGAHVSFYDWYADLPPASPQTFGEQTDVAEARDWWNSSYVLVWGSNVPVTRTPDAHFLAESRYHGEKVVVVAPDYAEHAKFADHWLPVAPGSDGALAMAMGHVVLKEFHVDRQSPYFTEYCRTFTDLPFLVRLAESPRGGYVPDRMMTVSDLGEQPELAAFRPVIFDEATATIVSPPGVMAAKYADSDRGTWNLRLDDLVPAMSMAKHGTGTAEVLFPRFDQEPAGVVRRGVPVIDVDGVPVTTVFDLMLAHYGVERPDMPGTWPTGYEDATEPYTPAWQEDITGIDAALCIRIAREFATAAEKTEGRAMAIMGAGINHWFNSDTVYRSILTLLIACGTVGRNGGGMNHYVGQEAIRPFGGWVTLSHALDWSAPPRQCNGTAYYYTATDQWRYEVWQADDLASPLGDGRFEGRSFMDCLNVAVRLGWQVTYPTFAANPLDLADEARALGKEPAEHVVDRLADGSLRFSVEDPDDPVNFPRLLMVWRSNILGGSGKGHEFFIRHLLGGAANADASETEPDRRPQEVIWRDQAPIGKLDLLVNFDFRMTSTANFADVVFPAATWYEKFDLSCTDLHPFVHSFNKAIDPPWEARSDWDAFSAIAESFSELAAKHLGVRQDIVAVSIAHDSAGELSVPHGRVDDWRVSGSRPNPGVNAPKLVVVERDYAAVHAKWQALGPRVETAGVTAKDYHSVPSEQVAWLAEKNGTVAGGPAAGRPQLTTDQHCAEAMLALSGATNGAVALDLWRDAESVSGLDLTDLVAGQSDIRITWDDVSQRPQHVINSPDWTGDVSAQKAYTGYAVNVAKALPWRTLTGRISFFLDHEWMKEYGEMLPIYRPPLNMMAKYSQVHDLDEGSIAVRYLTPHSKWSIHSEYQDDLLMLTLFRGGPTVWVSVEDAAEIGLRDGEWAEVWNRNGVIDGVAAVSPRMPKGLVYVYHAKDRQVQTPLTERTGRRGGTENSLTRALLKPTHMIGGYGQLSYGFNYYGCTGSQRDEVAVLRRRSQEVQY